MEGALTQASADQVAATPEDPIPAARHAVLLAREMGTSDARALAVADRALEIAELAARDDATPNIILDALGIEGGSVAAHADRVQATLDSFPLVPTSDDARGRLAHARALAALSAPDAPVHSNTPTDHATLAEAFDALFATGPAVALSPAERAQLERVLAAPPHTQRALTLLIDAVLDAQQAALTEAPLEMAAAQARALARVSEAVPLLMEHEHSAVSLMLCPHLGLDLEGVPSTWDCDLRLVVDVGGDDLHKNNAGGTRGAVGGAMVLDLAGNDTYDAGHVTTGAGLNGGANGGVAFLLDLAGDDLYAVDMELPAFSSAIANGGSGLGYGFLFDGGGSDVYSVRVASPGPIDAGVNGGAAVLNFGNAAMLYDSWGDDRYEASFTLTGAAESLSSLVANGAGQQNTGILFDGGGNDEYLMDVNSSQRVGLTANGAASVAGSQGLLIDLGGDDTYRVSATGSGNVGVTANGGSGGGAGRLFDLNGDDTYLANATSTGGNVTLSVHGAGADGLLYDAAGRDAYRAHADAAGSIELAAHGAGTASLLFEGGGDDTYEVIAESGGDLSLAANGGGYSALVDLDGSDTYVVHARSGLHATITANAGGAAALLLDGGGSDDYLVDLAAVGNASVSANGGVVGAGWAALLDGGGDNTFTVRNDAGGSVIAASHGAATGKRVCAGASTTHLVVVDLELGCANVAGALGVLFTGDGNDTFLHEGGGATQGTGTHAGVGILVDAGGTNTYTARAGASTDGVAQGAGFTLGAGVLVDRGVSATFSIDAGVAGQGAGIAGVGLLIQTRGDTVTQYTAAPFSIPSLVHGGGLGLRLNRGPIELIGAYPRLDCPPDTYEFAGFDNATLANQRVLTMHLCSPDAGEQEPLVNPVTQTEVGDVTKPAVPCRDLAPCAMLDDLLGPGPADWLERDHAKSTTSGGLTMIGASNALLLRGVVLSADSACEVTCASTGALDAIG